MNIRLLIGALFGLTSVMMAAYSDHHLAALLSDHAMNSVSTAVRYQQWYAVVLVVLGLSSYLALPPKMQFWLKLASWCFAIGVLCFSFSIYMAVITERSAFTYLTPCGGMMIMAGWLLLMRAALVKTITR